MPKDNASTAHACVTWPVCQVGPAGYERGGEVHDQRDGHDACPRASLPACSPAPRWLDDLGDTAYMKNTSHIRDHIKEMVAVAMPVVQDPGAGGVGRGGTQGCCCFAMQPLDCTFCTIRPSVHPPTHSWV